MKLNLFGKALLLTGVFSMAACSDDAPLSSTAEPTVGKGEGVFMSLNIEMPSAKGSRSTTTTDGQSNDGTEVGSPDENNVKTVVVVLAKASDNSFIFAGSLDAIAPGEEPNTHKTTIKFQKTDLVDYYGRGTLDGTDDEVYVYAFCNPPSSFTDYLEDESESKEDWYDQIVTLSETFSADMSKDGSVTNSIWSVEGGFTMTNSKIAKRNLPKNIKDWDEHKTAATAFNLSGVNHPGDDMKKIDNSGAVEVERLACRFDFMDGSTLGDNTYNVVFESDGTTPIIQVKLTKMMLTNMAKEFYLLPRVSQNGMNSGSTLCGSETASNYVVGPNATAFKWDDWTTASSNEPPFTFATYFNYPLYTQSLEYNISNWNPYLIEDVLGGNDDNYDGDYKVWRYATENVIPAPAVNQTYGKTTIVVFKGKLTVPEDAAANNAELAKYLNNEGKVLTGNPDNDPILYSYSGNLYFSWEEVRKAAIMASVQMTDGVPDLINTGSEETPVFQFANVGRTNPFYIAVFGAIAGQEVGMGTFKWGETYYTDDPSFVAPTGSEVIVVNEPAPDPNSANSRWIAWDEAHKPGSGDLIKNMREAMTDAKFTLYQSSIDKETGNGYYCYYFYRNRHNDNNITGTMGAMEFATVRNNVYKLAVTAINQLGHPRITGNDPDAPGPDTPDETDDIYLTVTCKVLPWVVRINNIEF